MSSYLTDKSFVRQIQEEFKNFNPSIELPVADHIHFFGMYIGNFPELTKKEIDWLLKVINNV